MPRVRLAVAMYIFTLGVRLAAGITPASRRMLGMNKAARARKYENAIVDVRWPSLWKLSLLVAEAQKQ